MFPVVCTGVCTLLVEAG